MSKSPLFIKTRIAPTPSGYLHLGNVLSFAVTSFLARRNGAAVFLRIDDLDRSRVTRAYVDDIFETLTFMNISWQEGPRNYGEYERNYSQLHRLHLYEAALASLVSSGEVFACECSRADLERISPDGVYPGTCLLKNIPIGRKGVSWRVRTEGAELPATMHNFIIRRKDGLPAYQLSSVVDDLFFGIDGIIRGKDLWPSTQAQLFLSALLPRHIPTFHDRYFYHHPLLSDLNGQKLSKSNGSMSIQYLRNQGASADDIYMLIAKALGVPDESDPDLIVEQILT